MDGFACALQFDTSTTDFVRGVEIGRLWEKLQLDAGPVDDYVHASNAEMILRLSEATGRAVRSEDLDDTWMFVTFEAA